MNFLDGSLFIENQDKLVITAAPYGPEWMPSDFPEDIPVTMDAQVQKAVDCYNAGASVLHLHVRELDGKGSKRLSKFNELIAGVVAIDRLLDLLFHRDRDLAREVGRKPARCIGRGGDDQRLLVFGKEVAVEEVHGVRLSGCDAKVGGGVGAQYGTSPTMPARSIFRGAGQ